MALRPFQMLINPRRGPSADVVRRSPLNLRAGEAARAEIAQCPLYRPTPLHSLHDLAAQAGVAKVYYKDEGGRLGLGSFKALGGSFAVSRVLRDAVRRRIGGAPSLADLAEGRHRDITRELTVTCASDGNHGRAVAAGARVFGCDGVIFLHEGVSQGREDAILRLGARVTRVAGDYDDSVDAAAAAAAAQGWLLVADTAASDTDAATPILVMQGYYTLTLEVIEQLAAAGEARPTHVFLQAGVGGLAGAVVSHFAEAFGDDAPKAVIVEPERADCLFQSARAGRPAAATGDLDTLMAGLACGEVSTIAWPILDQGAFAFMTLADEAAVELMIRLAEHDPPIVAGESATAGLAGLLAAARQPEGRGALGLDAQSRVLVIGTEADTDPDLYAQLVGHPAAAEPGR